MVYMTKTYRHKVTGIVSEIADWLASVFADVLEEVNPAAPVAEPIVEDPFVIPAPVVDPIDADNPKAK